MAEWMPIETAPKDGRRVQLLIPYSQAIFTEADCADEGFWEPCTERDWTLCAGLPMPHSDAMGCWRFDGDDGSFDIQPTHWRPLPAPPDLPDEKVTT